MKDIRLPLAKGRDKGFFAALYVILALALLICLLSLVYGGIYVDGGSMKDTLHDGDFVVMNKLAKPERGDIVVISKRSFDDGSPIVKRVIATQGQTVDIDFSSGTVYVDGTALEEDYINDLTTNAEGMTFPLTVEEGHIFVLGDNRGVSKDSRHPEIGQIDQREILGKAIYLMIPGTHHNMLPRENDRIGAIS